MVLVINFDFHHVRVLHIKFLLGFGKRLREQLPCKSRIVARNRSGSRVKVAAKVCDVYPVKITKYLLCLRRITVRRPRFYVPNVLTSKQPVGTASCGGNGRREKFLLIGYRHRLAEAF